MDYRLIALDIDGTLTNSEKQISTPTLEALLDIQQSGSIVVINCRSWCSHGKCTRSCKSGCGLCYGF